MLPKGAFKLVEIRRMLYNVAHNVQSVKMNTDICDVRESSQSKTDKLKPSKGD